MGRISLLCEALGDASIEQVTEEMQNLQVRAERESHELCAYSLLHPHMTTHRRTRTSQRTTSTC